MAEIIYKAGLWLIEQDPTMAARPDLVRFVKRGPSGRKTLDQIAQWTGNGWDPKRWVPKVPTVPKALLEKVEAHMRGVQPHLDHASLGSRKWCWAAGCWREWSETHAEWLPSAPPPAEAHCFNYRTHILGSAADRQP